MLFLSIITRARGEHNHGRHHHRCDDKERGHLHTEQFVSVPNVSCVIHCKRGNNIHADERRHVHNDVPTIRAVFVGHGVAVCKLFEIEMLFRGFGFDALFNKYTANDKTAAEQSAEHQTHAQPELRRRKLRHKQESRSVGVGESLDKHERQHVAESRRDCGKDKFDGVCVVALPKRRGYVACHRAIRHLRDRRAGVPQQIHQNDVRRKSAHAHSPLSHGQKHKEYTQQKRYTAPEHIGFSSSPFSARVVGNEAHKRVGDCVPELCNHHDCGRKCHCDAVFCHVRKHNTRHHTHAAAVHKTAYAVCQFLFERDSVRLGNRL